MTNPTSPVKPFCLALMALIGAVALWHGFWILTFSMVASAVFALVWENAFEAPND